LRQPHATGVSSRHIIKAKNMEQFISQLSVSFPNNNKSIFTGIPIKFNLFISNNIIIREASKISNFILQIGTWQITDRTWVKKV
jgi:hypothetical protein